MKSRIVAILSDLGTRDYFVAAIKGAILSISPDAKIVDVTHEVPKYNIQAAAFILWQVAKAFSKGTIFIVVVDPGVGTERKCVLLQTKNDMLFIAPDNGVLTFVAKQLGVAKIYRVANQELMGHKPSMTFHGRDIMAPVAAHLSLGVEPSKVGPKLTEIKLFEIPRPAVTKNEIRGQIMSIDNFGDIMTNIDAATISKFANRGTVLLVTIENMVIPVKFVRTFGEVEPRESLCYIGSSGMLELASNMGNLADELKVKIGSGLIIKR